MFKKTPIAMAIFALSASLSMAQAETLWNGSNHTVNDTITGGYENWPGSSNKIFDFW